MYCTFIQLMTMYFSEQGFYSVMEITKFDRGEWAATPKSRMKPYFVIPNFEGWTRYNHRNIFLIILIKIVN